MSYHIIYQPAEPDKRIAERIISLIETDKPKDIRRAIYTHPSALALQLEATDEEEALAELSSLGFTY